MSHSMLNQLNKINSTKPSGVIVQPPLGLHNSLRIQKPKGKLMDRIKDAKTKKEKQEIILEWTLCEIKAVNKASECEDF